MKRIRNERTWKVASNTEFYESRTSPRYKRSWSQTDCYATVDGRFEFERTRDAIRATYSRGTNEETSTRRNATRRPVDARHLKLKFEFANSNFEQNFTSNIPEARRLNHLLSALSRAYSFPSLTFLSLTLSLFLALPPPRCERYRTSGPVGTATMCEILSTEEISVSRGNRWTFEAYLLAVTAERRLPRR